MRYRLLPVLAAVILTAAAASADEIPHSIAGFTLGQPIEAVSGRVLMTTALPVRYMENLREVEIRPVAGFKSGLIAYGTCRRPEQIVRIKLKYADESREFFEDLLKRYKNRFGKPDEYRGDPFGVLVSWKWSFSEPNGNRISLVLQHNQQDEDEKLGNAVKLTLANRLEEDADCARRRPDHRRDPAPGTAAPAGEKAEWDALIPAR